MDRLERLVNLVAALIDTPRPLTRAEIKERIDGYSEDPEAFRRNFERDKDLLRQMGFPLVTVGGEAGSNEEQGYRIPRDLYELPDAGLDESELAALRLAASAVQLDGEWGRDAVTRALRKLGGAAGDRGNGNRGIPGRLAAIPGGEAAAAAFAAVAACQRVRFRYHGQARLVDPWSLSFHRGRWYMAGLDHGRGEERLYRLDRLEGPLTPTGEPGAYERPEGVRAAPPPSWRIGDEEEVTAVLLVDAEQADQARRALGPDRAETAHPDGSVELTVAVTNTEAFLSFVLGFLEHAEILGPAPLRGEMVAYLNSLSGEAEP
jgi:predicted DNA-binding transcriptional regulator YafY